jgi:two-component system sensor histidine kinase HydH
VRQGAAAGAGRIDCAAVVDEALRYAAHLVAASGIAVVREVPEEPALARGDAALLRPAVLNLIRNAVQAMPAGGRLTVRVARAGGTVTVTVADTGPGIPRAAREAVFTPFFTTRAKGTGLGLTVVRELVAALGGVVEVEDPAEGAALTVRLPAA